MPLHIPKYKILILGQKTRAFSWWRKKTIITSQELIEVNMLWPFLKRKRQWKHKKCRLYFLTCCNTSNYEHSEDSQSAYGLTIFVTAALNTEARTLYMPQAHSKTLYQGYDTAHSYVYVDTVCSACVLLLYLSNKLSLFRTFTFSTM